MIVETIQVPRNCRDIILGKAEAGIALPTANLILEARPVGRKLL